jgi:hypothetical protein
MCLLIKKKNKKKMTRKKKNKIQPYIYSENIQSITTEQFLRECIACYHCKEIFNLESNELKINCAGCDNFFHCNIAGKCKCQLSWCNNCVLIKLNDKCRCSDCIN